MNAGTRVGLGVIVVTHPPPTPARACIHAHMPWRLPGSPRQTHQL